MLSSAELRDLGNPLDALLAHLNRSGGFRRHQDARHPGRERSEKRTAGVAPATARLGTGGSATELRPHDGRGRTRTYVDLFREPGLQPGPIATTVTRPWRSGRRGLHPRPTDWQPVVLLLNYVRMMGLEGLAPSFPPCERGILAARRQALVLSRVRPVRMTVGAHDLALLEFFGQEPSRPTPNQLRDVVDLLPPDVIELHPPVRVVELAIGARCLGSKLVDLLLEPVLDALASRPIVATSLRRAPPPLANVARLTSSAVGSPTRLRSPALRTSARSHPSSLHIGLLGVNELFLLLNYRPLNALPGLAPGTFAFRARRSTVELEGKGECLARIRTESIPIQSRAFYC